MPLLCEVGILALQTWVAGFEAILLHEPHESQSRRCSAIQPSRPAGTHTASASHPSPRGLVQVDQQQLCQLSLLSGWSAL